MNKWNISQLLSHAEGYAASHNHPAKVRGSHHALVEYIRTDPKFSHDRAAHVIV
jgi:hypothetical protein